MKKMIMEAAIIGAAMSVFAARDPAVWPFAADSPWNCPIGSEAEYVEIERGLMNLRDGGVTANRPIVNCLTYSINLYRAAADDPVAQLQTWYEPILDQCVERIRVPEEAVPSRGTDGHLSIIDPEGRYVYEVGVAKRVFQDFPGGYLNGWCSFKNDLRGPGVYPEIHGTRAYGGSSLGGLIRQGELTHGIPHALAIGTDPGNLSSRAPGGKTYVWPACSSDYEFPNKLFPAGAKPFEDWYGDSGNLYIGTLLAIPPEVDLTRIGIEVPGPTYEIARALQDYGGYIVDMAGAPLVLYAEHGAADELGGAEAIGHTGGGAGLELDRLLPYLRVVSNNGPDSPGGGGRPRRPPAPPFDDGD